MGIPVRRRPTRRRLFSFGFALSPWQTARLREHQAIGRFEGDASTRDLEAAGADGRLVNMRDDDAFWAARRVMAFTDEMIRAVVKAGQYSDPAGGGPPGRGPDRAPRQDWPAYLTRLNPIVDPALDAATC